jgi:hypothetical protein
LDFGQKTKRGSNFQAQDLLRPCARPQEAAPLVSVSTVPVFLTPEKFFRHSWLEMLQVAATPYPAHLTNISTQLFRQLPLRLGRISFRPVSLSLVVHFLGVLSLPFLLNFLSVSADEDAFSRVNQAAVIYYKFPSTPDRRRVPKILPPGPGSAPGSGSLPEKSPSLGATKAGGALFAVSHPKIPDNDHRTILQSQSPPDLKIKTDLKLPNLIVQNRTVPKAPLNFHADTVRPLTPTKKEVSNLEPSINTANSVSQFSTTLSASQQKAHLAVPIGAAPAPRLPSAQRGEAGDTAVPEIGAGEGISRQGLVILSTDPGDPTGVVALPPGNQYGQFSIAPVGSGSGSPGGVAEGVAGGGTGGGESGGNESAGVGTGNSGGGGGNSGSPGFLSLRGTGDASEKLLDPHAGLTESLVFALPKITGTRHPGVVVATGPIGGGGLSVYGALRCGKIYTVSLPMSGKNWTLEYCQTPLPGSTSPSTTRSTVVHIEEALVPPEAEIRFDFKRLPLPVEKLHKMIVLKGTIRPDGGVENVTIHEGLIPEMDVAAVRAFSQWRFKPAIRGWKPVSIDVLLGIPGDLPGTGLGVTARMVGDKAGEKETTKSY